MTLCGWLRRLRSPIPSWPHSPSASSRRAPSSWSSLRPCRPGTAVWPTSKLELGEKLAAGLARGHQLVAQRGVAGVLAGLLEATEHVITE